MKGRLLVFGGTSEAKALLEHGMPAICSVTTEYGAKLLEGLSNCVTVVGRQNSDEMISLIRRERISGVVDATHPYAIEVTRNISSACSATGTPLIRLLRKSSPVDERITLVKSCSEAAELLKNTKGNILLTTGSKELEHFTSIKNYKKRLFVRVLPSSNVLLHCEKLSFDAGHIIAIQGPFTEEMNKQMLVMTNASVLVTKDGGAFGGLEDKIAAAHKLKIKVVLIERPNESGHDMQEVLQWIRTNI